MLYFSWKYTIETPHESDTSTACTCVFGLPVRRENSNNDDTIFISLTTQSSLPYWDW